jgi:hypothetical protein
VVVQKCSLLLQRSISAEQASLDPGVGGHLTEHGSHLPGKRARRDDHHTPHLSHSAVQETSNYGHHIAEGLPTASGGTHTHIARWERERATKQLRQDLHLQKSSAGATDPPMLPPARGRERSSPWPGGWWPPRLAAAQRQVDESWL